MSDYGKVTVERSVLIAALKAFVVVSFRDNERREKKEKIDKKKKKKEKKLRKDKKKLLGKAYAA